MKYRHILLDVGGTLIFPKPSVGQVYASEARLFSVDMDAQEAQKAFVRAWKASKAAWKAPLRYGRTEEDAKTFWRDVVYRTFHSRVPDEKKEDLFTHLFHHFARPEIWDCYDGVHETLKELYARGHILSVLSNWDIRLPHILQGLGLSAYFHHEFISFATGLEKPDPN
ncbi:MAG: HAD hydrolase-like protein, partial [Spirochaetota bacterium]|nr:HAD hydrolase-like protein [Spirochaetota bacterium]